ncbi:MAG: sugar kinase [Dehalococcoidia bacterium]|nr:sugar kinase [Dehalococcoidia bacterium]MEC7921379.1 PfkB family carbohydrate kinase [Chloroflexota bacterium]|tara:strand:+ start:438 stop:1370 length:933 start_codon:yes stop_codon:yes gene_type:complete
MKLKVVGVLAYDSITSEFGKKTNIFGGSATYFAISSSYLSNNVRITGAIGKDFNTDDLNILSSRGINIDGVEKLDLNTFKWEGKYETNAPNEAITLSNSIINGEPNVLESYKPTLYSKNENKSEEYSLFLANADPEHQLDLINQMDKRAKLIGLDTMDFWINNSAESVKRLFPNVDVIIINENEAKLITNENSLRNCIEKIQNLGAERMVIKLGNYGLVYASNSTRFFLPAVLVEQVKDPTGAGDSFAGGFMGYLSTVENLSEEEFKDACIYGSVMASFCVEEFGLERLLSLDNNEIENRKNLLIKQIKY